MHDKSFNPPFFILAEKRRPQGEEHRGEAHRLWVRHLRLGAPQQGRVHQALQVRVGKNFGFGFGLNSTFVSAVCIFTSP